MPTYDYICEQCDYEFEHLQSMTMPALTQCPECSGKVNRLMGSGSGLVFKGTGFYETDYKRPQSKEVKKDTSKVKDSISKSDNKLINSEK